MVKKEYTLDESRRIIDAFDTILSITGGPKLMDIFGKLDKGGVPKDMQVSLVDMMAREVGGSLGTAVSEWTTAMAKVTDSPEQIQEILKKLKNIS